MDVLTVALQLAYYVAFGAAVWRFIRRPGRIELALVAIFSTTAALFAISLLNSFAPGISQTLRPLALTLLLAQPVLVFVLVTLLRTLPRWSLLVVCAAFVVAVLGVVLPPQILPPVALYVAGYFMLVEGVAALLLFSESRRRFGVARLRLGLASLATALFGAAIFIAALGAAATGTAGASDSSVTVLSRLAALAAAVGYICAFVPPRWLRNIGQRAVAFDVARRLIVGDAGTQPGVLWDSLARAGRDILGARRVSIVDAGGALLADTTDEPAAGDPRRRLTTASARIVADGILVATLVSELEGQPLFVEDDLEVLHSLGLMTVRAIEREQALLRVGEADRQLAESAAVRASEARFRALLEAHPNAVPGGGRPGPRDLGDRPDRRAVRPAGRRAGRRATERAAPARCGRPGGLRRQGRRASPGEHRSAR